MRWIAANPAEFTTGQPRKRHWTEPTLVERWPDPGRLGGYEARYIDPKGFRPLRPKRAYSLGTEVELFRDEATASAYLEKQVAEIAESRGRLHQGVKIAAAGRFDVDDVGDEAHGFTATLSSGDLSLFTTGVAFRRGRVVGSVDVLQALELESSAEMKRVADELDDRIKDVMAGEIEKTAGLTRRRDWRRAGPDPRRLTLAARDLSLPMSPTHRRYLRTPNLNGYFRKYESVRPVPLGASKIFYLRTTAAVFRSARLADRDQKFIASRSGSETVARRFLRGFFRRTDFRPSPVDARPLPSPHSDSSLFQFSLAVPSGRVRFVLVGVRHGRRQATIMGMGFESQVDPSDVLALRGTLRARLRASH